MSDILTRVTVFGRRIAVLSTLACTMAFTQPAISADFQWSYYSVSPQMHPYSEILNRAFDRIEERSDGRLSIDLVFFGETPYRGAEAEKLMRDGLVEMTEWLLGYSTSTYPLLSGPELPFLPDRPMDPAEHIIAIDQAWQSATVKDELDGILDQHDAIRLSRFYWPPQNHWLTQPIDSPEGFRGMKIREFSAEGIDFTTAIGAIPVSMTAPEVYTGLQRGALDGVVTASTSMIGLNWGEVLSAGYITNFKLSISLILVSERAFESLPDDIKPILQEEIETATQEILDFMVANETELHRELEAEHGFTMNYATQEHYNQLREIAQTEVWPAWVSRVGADVGQPMLDGVLQSLNEASVD